MKINVPRWDQMLRLFIGIVMIAWAVAGGPWWAYAGICLLATGTWRLCPIRSAFERDQKRDQKRDQS